MSKRPAIFKDGGLAGGEREPQVAPAAPVPPPSVPSVSDLEKAYGSVAEVPEDV